MFQTVHMFCTNKTDTFNELTIDVFNENKVTVTQTFPNNTEKP